MAKPGEKTNQLNFKWLCAKHKRYRQDEKKHCATTQDPGLPGCVMPTNFQKIKATSILQ